MGNMRCFVAVKIPEKITGDILSLISPYRSGINGRFIKPDAGHLTLKFIGELDENKVPKVCEILEKICGRFERFGIALKNFGTFPPKRPRVLWAGIENGSLELSALAGKISKRLFKKMKIREEKRKFVPHFTVCRLKTPFLPEEIFKIDFKFLFPVEKIFFIHSFLSPTGAQYKDIAEFHLLSKT
ncbi:MAG: RNA 2',3'-cyclic phosphodiesterase [Elusimicrobia bacterium]|nr:RNA 2',3'-cyclic phosphodiesterase [Elusimicrobiota bacterium]